MNIFPSQLRLFQSENSTSNVIRKQDGFNAAVFRKPFADRTIKCNSPNITTAKKAACDENEAVESVSQFVSDLGNDDFSSNIKFENDDYYEDILPLSKRLEDDHVHQICAKFLAGDEEDIDCTIPHGLYEYQYNSPSGDIAADILWTARILIGRGIQNQVGIVTN